jgi:DNA-directed RNA polymerase subunit RPC12/RpoP
MKSAAERMRDRRMRLRAERKCVICGKADAQPDRTMCAECQAGSYRRVVARRTAKLSGVLL